MKDNKNVLNEAFFKKASYSDSVKKKMPGYEPVRADSVGGLSGQHAIDNDGVFAVTDAKEMKKRLAGTFGAAFGDNSIKSMAGKAVKTFPILVSDNIEPETVLSLKRLMEEQYADYISLLISNKVIDLSAFDTATADGSTIAIQALDTISGTDFSKNRIANKAMNTGELSMDDIGTNIPLYNLLRENHIENFELGDKLLDELFENALIVPSDKVNEVSKYICENADEMILNEFVQQAKETTPYERDPDEKPVRVEDKPGYRKYLAQYEAAEKEEKPKKAEVGEKEENIIDAIAKTVNKYGMSEAKIDSYDRLLDKYAGKEKEDVYTKLSNAEILVNKGQFDNVMNRTVAELLMDPKNAPIKDRFEKASILLQAEMISGSEFIDYCTLRLGIPISSSARATLSSRFRRVKSWNRRDSYQNSIFMTDKELTKIKQNKRVFDKSMGKVLDTKVGAWIAGTVGAAGTIAGAIGAGFAAVLNPLLLAAIIPATVGAGAYTLYKTLKLIKGYKYGFGKQNKVEGWERVEMLIERMDQQRAEVIAKVSDKKEKPLSDQIYRTVSDTSSIVSGKASLKNYQGTLSFIDNPTSEKKKDEGRPLSGDEIQNLQLQVSDLISTKRAASLAEGVTQEFQQFPITEEEIKERLNIFNEALDECMKEEEFRNILLAESLFKKKETTMPVKKVYVEKKPGKDVLIAPQFSARSVYAYGSTEIDSKAVKDRKFNQPLFMTIKFKQRFDDGRFSDNELTAVIGILGRVIRIPSSEMEYILTENTTGETVSGIFKSGNMKNMVSDLLSVSKISDEVKNLPQSADVWKNLEKVASLAIANKYSGKKSGNIANAHIVFSEKEIDNVRLNTGVDYKRDMKLTAQLLKHYSAFTLMIADDPAERLYIYNDEDDISWNVVPYNAIRGKDTGDQLASALSRISTLR